MFVVVTKYLIPNGFAGMALFPFIFLKEKKHMHNASMILHEKIHLRQQAELLILPFFIWYGLEFLVRLLQHKNKNLAYRNISFEREAYANESTTGFLEQRSFWNFIKYM
jgi:hypothetical protein